MFMATEQATVKKTSLAEFVNVNRKGKYAITLEEGDSLIGVALTDGRHDVMLFSDQGKAVRFAETDVRSMGRTARGVGGMKLEQGGKLISMLVAESDDQLVLTASENGYGKCTPITEYTRHGRNTKGMIAIAMSERNGKIVAATLVRPGDSVMLLTSHGHLVRTPVDSISVVGRGAQGVTLIDVRDDKLVRISRIAEDDADEEAKDEDLPETGQPSEEMPESGEDDPAPQAEPSGQDPEQ